MIIHRRQPGAGRGPARPNGRFAPSLSRWISACAGVTGVLLAAGAAIAQGPPPAPKPETRSSRPAATGGEALYLEHCAMCHGPNGMGTGLLGRRIQPALLEERDNLPAQYVILAARQGIGNMPAIPRGEVSDEDLKQIADYLAAGPHQAAQ
jgi:mono/diheme cytochrome c family protein